jgi:hypothetical protein
MALTTGDSYPREPVSSGLAVRKPVSTRTYEELQGTGAWRRANETPHVRYVWTFGKALAAAALGSKAVLHRNGMARGV